MYDPLTGRFTSPDPADPNPQAPETFEPYSFANNNPHLFSDPTGEFSIAEVNITADLQTNLDTLKQIAVQQAREYIKDKIEEFTIDILVNTIKGLVPVNGILGKVFGLGGNVARAGKVFGGFVQQAMCNVFHAPNWIYFETAILQNSGDPRDDGFNCGEKGVGDPDYSFRIRLPSSEGPRRRPDMILGNSLPFTDQVKGNGGDNWTVLEVKLSTKTLANEYAPGGRSVGQLEAIANYTHKYTVTHSIAVFVTLFQGGKGGQNWKTNLAKFAENAAKNGLAAIVISLTGTNRTGKFGKT